MVFCPTTPSLVASLRRRVCGARNANRAETLLHLSSERRRVGLLSPCRYASCDGGLSGALFASHPKIFAELSETSDADDGKMTRYASLAKSFQAVMARRLLSEAKEGPALRRQRAGPSPFLEDVKLRVLVSPACIPTSDSRRRITRSRS